jgi:hydrophobic/amphiphilic exporter-1 (mainly G- bacteria), HAE1 family
MQWNLSSWSIRHVVPTTALFLVLAVVGAIAFGQLGIDETPNIDMPIVSVTVTQMGASPSELETQVTRKVEDSIAGIPNIKHINSTASDGVSATVIEFEIGTNTDRATNDVRDAVTKIRQQLPQGINEPIVARVDWVGGAFATYTVSSAERTATELSWLVDNDIGRALRTVSGVGKVSRSGGVDREVRVNLDPIRLKAVGATADMVNTQIRALNIDLPGGRGEVGGAEQSVRTLGSSPTVARLAATQIALPNGNRVRLDTLGKVLDGSSEERNLAYLNGKPVVAFWILRSNGSNLVDVEKGVDKKLDELRKSLPRDIEITKIRTNGRYIRDSYSATLDSLMIGALLSLVVIWWYVRDRRATLISSLAIPLSIVPTFAVMKWVGFTMNGMSLLALALVIGILVDDAIVEIENIVRHLRMGKKPFDAACDAADEIALAVIATTMTVIVVFVPVAFMGGIVGQFFKQFGLVVAVAVFFSLLVARMLTPMMAAYLMKELAHEEEKGILSRWFAAALAWALEHRLASIGMAILIFAGSLVMFKMMPTSLISNIDRSESVMEVSLAPGATVEDMKRVAVDASAVFKARPEVDSVFLNAGGESAVNKGTFFVKLTPKDKRKLSQQQFEDDVRKDLDRIPGTRFGFFRSIGGGTKPMQIALTSENLDLLTRYSDELLSEMRKIKGLYDVASSASILRPELIFTPDFSRAAEQGVSVQSIARTALIATLGDNDFNMAKFNLKDRQINIRVQLDPRYREDIQVLEGLQVQGADGRLVPLRAVGQFKLGSGPAEIARFDRSRQITVDAALSADTTIGDAMKALHALPAYKNMPLEIKEQPVGDAEIQRDVFTGFGTAIGYAVLLIYTVLVLLFGGFLHPVTIMVSLPLSLCGALLALVVTGNSLGMYALIGIVMLMGLVTKNSILLVEYCLKAERAGMSRSEAIRAATSVRMRPIIMTTIAMIAGMLPIALKMGAGSEARAPMAIAVIGGLITSTILTLVLVPVVYTYIDDFQNWILKFILKRQPPQQHSDEAQSRIASSRR